MQVEGEQYKDQVSALLDQANAANSFVIDIPQMSVGRLKGRGGETIRQLTATTRTKIDIDSNNGTEMARITIKGMNNTDVQKCHDSIQDLCMGSGRGYPALDNSCVSKGQVFGHNFVNYNFGAHCSGLNNFGVYSSVFGVSNGVVPYRNPISSYRYSGGNGLVSHPTAQRSINDTAVTWTEQYDDQHRIYYYNTQTGVSQWEKPN